MKVTGQIPPFAPGSCSALTLDLGVPSPHVRALSTKCCVVCGVSQKCDSASVLVISALRHNSAAGMARAVSSDMKSGLRGTGTHRRNEQ